MNTKQFLTVFATIFLAELGDKTQLVTLLFATGKEINRLTVFLAASVARVATSAVGVMAGTILSQYISEKQLHLIAGTGLIYSRRSTGVSVL